MERHSLWKTIINSLRSQGKIVLAVASSGIASLLLPSGRTTHSIFKLPLELTEESICGIKKTHAEQLLAETHLIIWDESPMNDRRCFEALDRTLRDIMDTPNQLFGGKSIVLGGEFRQTLSMKKGASKLEIVASSIAELELWHHFKVCTLTKNMQLMQTIKNQAEQNLSRVFANWLLDIGNGSIGEPNTSDPQNSSWVYIPERYSIPDDEHGISKLIDFIYDKNTLQNPNTQELQQKAIVCPRNDTADSTKSEILKMIEGESVIYKSSDEAIPLKNDGGVIELLYPTEYLNSLQFLGFPPHELQLKVGKPIMLLRNVNLQGACVTARE
ncbi:DNA helicase [Tanacetum coccineum]